MIISILDIGISNVFSLKTTINSMGYDVLVTSSPEDLNKSDKIIFPGVGSYKIALDRFKKLNLEDVFYKNVVIKKKPFLGICVGMQILSENGYEMGKHKGLGIIKGDIKYLKEIGCDLQIPHVGWNHVKMKENILTKNIEQNSDFYFIHSYSYHGLQNDEIFGLTNHGCEIVAIINKNNIFGTQFHPEKSSKAGKKLIKNFIDI